MADTTVVNGTAVAEIAKLAGEALQNIPIVPVKVNDQEIPMSYMDLHDVRPRETEPKPLVIHTLQGLLDYVEANRDAFTWTENLIQVIDPTTVELVSRLSGVHAQRFTYVRAAVPEREGFSFKTFMDVEAMNIRLQALFVDDFDRAAVIQCLGTVTADTGVTLADDGVTQNVAMKQGVLVRGAVPNPVTLAPFRTFTEIAQPESLFILRVKANENSQVFVALFEADGGAWQAEAISRIAAYLRAHLPEDLKVIA